MKTALKIETSRSDYSPKQVIENRNVMTVGELLEALRIYDEDTPIVLSFDEGYTYGSFTGFDMDTIDIPETDDEEEELAENDY